MDCAQNQAVEQNFNQKIVTAMVGALIDRRGYYEVIDELIAEVHKLGEISLADPSSSAKLREFDIWAQAVRAAIRKHDDENTFENRVTASDRRFAIKMGILLD